jgi:colanic acid biosynthesis glycosyl transferase WcaI
MRPISNTFMRILVLTINYWPEQTGIGAVLTRRCEYLASVGHEVTVCTGMPYYPEWRIHSGYTGKLFCSEQRNGVNILRSWMWVPQNVTSAKRVLFEASFLASSLLRSIQNRRPELLLVVSPPLGLGLSAGLLSRWWNIPYVFDVQDLQPDAAADLGMLPGPLLPVLYRLEALAYRNAALIATVTEGMRQKIVAKGIPASKVVVVPPPADSRLFGVGSVVEGHDFRSKHGLDGKFVVAHSGNMGVKQGLDVVLDAALHLREQRDLVFLLAGDGAMKSRLEERAAALQLANVRFLPLQEHAEFLQMLAAMDMGLIVQQSSVSDTVFPSKTVTLLSAARPVGAAVSADSEISRVIRQSGGGVVTEPENVEALAATIQGFSRDPEGRQAMGESGRRYALQYWDEARVLSGFEARLSVTGGTTAGGKVAESSVSI